MNCYLLTLLLILSTIDARTGTLDTIVACSVTDDVVVDGLAERTLSFITMRFSNFES
jgi:hypothetical protein